MQKLRCEYVQALLQNDPVSGSIPRRKGNDRILRRIFEIQALTPDIAIKQNKDIVTGKRDAEAGKKKKEGQESLEIPYRKLSSLHQFDGP